MTSLKKRYVLPFAVCLLLLAWGIILSLQSYHPPDRTEIALKMKYLTRVLRSPLDSTSDIQHLKYQNPEWMLFTLSFSAFACTNIAMNDTSYREESARAIDSAIQKVLTEPIYSHYSTVSPIPPIMDTAGSILYYGHLNMMLGCYRLLSNNPKYNLMHDQLSESMYQQYKASNYLNLESYPGRSWIPDNAAGIASLKLHSQITGSPYQQICTDWVAYARAHYTDKTTGVLCSTVDVHTGAPLEEPRGSMIGWTIFFLYRVDSVYARELYEHYKSSFGTNLGILSVYKERATTNESKDGDMDSGPIFRGYGIPASAFAFGDAVAFGDVYEAERLHRLVAIGSRSVVKDNEMTYQPRFGNLNFTPLAESLGLYFETMTEWKKQK